MVDGLNWLSGYRREAVEGALGKPDALQSEVLARLEGLVRDQEPSGKLQSPEAALRELLGSRSGYELDRGSSRLERLSMSTFMLTVYLNSKECLSSPTHPNRHL